MPVLDPGVPGTVAPWCEVETVSDDERCKAITLPDGVTYAMCVQSASEELFKLSGARWSGLRTDTIRWRKFIDQLPGGFVGWGWSEVSGVWNRVFPEGWAMGATRNEIILPGPVTSIPEILVDGDVFDPANYTLFDNRRLVRLDGLSWPIWQDLSKPTTEVGTWQITVQHGAAPPMAGVLAAREWSIQTALYVSTNRQKLPQRTSQVVRNGTTITVEAGSLLKDGLTGFPLVDAFIVSFNPKGLRRRARSYSVDDLQPAISSSSQP